MLVILRVGLLQGQLSLSLSLYVCVCSNRLRVPISNLDKVIYFLYLHSKRK
jgi:hypothetical protein